MNALTLWRRARAMTAGEVRFRAASAMRVHRDRVASRLRPPRWDSGYLATRLSRDVEALADVPRLLQAGACGEAEAVLSSHFSSRLSVWPIGAGRRESITNAIESLFPDARADARDRAERILHGKYDLLGHRDVSYGSMPDWHLDAVHNRRAPRRFWADVNYLDPACGDHKVTWELNRHQHWTSLGRAFWLQDDARYAEAFVNQLYSWLEANPPLSGVNWASMLELAFRSISWTWALEFFAGIDGAAAGHRPWRLDLLAGIDRHLAHIAKNLSRYFSPNTHLSGEALALFVVSLALPELRDSRARAALGRDVLLEETRRQVLPDGGHAERSTHYHRYSTDFYLLATLVARRSGDPAAGELAASARAQAEVLRTLADDTGALQTIGDDDGGQLFAMCGTAPSDVRTTLAVAAELFGDPSLRVSPPTEESCWIAGARPARAGRVVSIASRAGWPSRTLPHTGYFVSRAPGELAIFDVGRHGFLNGGHAHAGALAVLTTAGSKPLLIDPGTGTYTMDRALRDRLRSGRMHNTVLVDGAEHTEVRGPFHWSRRTDATLLLSQIGDRWDAAQGMHDGYAGRRHVRTLFSLHGVGWLIVDQILGQGTHRAESFWHIDPAWTVTRSGDSVLLAHRDGGRSIFRSSAAVAEIVREGPDAICAPEYGRLMAAPVVRTVHTAHSPSAVATFIACPPWTGPEDIGVEVYSCAAPRSWVGAGVVVSTAGLEITAVMVAPEPSAHDWPATRYGLPRLQTDRRAALAVRSGRERAGGGEMACAVHEVSG